jgi:hypothetical protein
MVCTASHALEQHYPDSDNQYSSEGTYAHDFAAHCLVNKINPKTMIGAAFEGDVISEEMGRHITNYVNFVRSRAKGKTLMVEQRVDFSNFLGVPESFGTADAIVIGARETMVIDLKYGKGVRVSAPSNKQLMMYALGVSNIAPRKAYKLIIHQPRMMHRSIWTVSHDHLMKFGEEANSAAKSIMQGQVKFTPGKDTCRFCKAKADCIAFKDWTLNSAVNVFSVINPAE